MLSSSQLMRTDEDGLALFAVQLDEQAAYGFEPSGIDAVGWLIQDEQIRIADQGHGDGQTLLHA